MAAQPTQRKASQLNELKSTSHATDFIIRSAQEGRKYKLVKNKTTNNIEQEFKPETSSPYFNKADGIPGQDTLQLNSLNFEKARAKGKDLVYVISHRIVGTRAEIGALVDKIAAVRGERLSLQGLLDPSNVVDVSNMNSARNVQLMQAEAARQSEQRQ